MSHPFQWSEVSDLLDAVMSLPAAERSSYLANACPDDALREYLQSLVLSYQDSAGFLERLPLLPDTPSSPEASAPGRSCLGRRIGPYVLVEEIGSGGMGVVFRAVRADDHYLKSVAIKLMKGEFTSRFSLMRFRVERQIMASLDHPNIARLYDGGTSEEGMPYLVMELIEGQPLDAYCDQHHLSITERLKLFRIACSAVHYAHQHLVIHRDLKPRNVLVTEDGQVKLLDFGIAKILDPEAFPQVVDPTVPLMRLLSPDYASPEQLRGERITTSSDVYSLGVLMYELLTGHKPYTYKAGSLTDLAAVVCGTEPPRPSDIIGRSGEIRGAGGRSIHVTPESVSALRDGQPGKLRRRLQGDLDNIVLKALRKEPERRYSSVAQLSEDIQRHLNGLPVMARMDTFAYRASKFMRRHTAFVASALLVTMSLIIGVTLTWREALIASAEKARAVRRFNEVRDLARSNVFDLFNALEAMPGSAPAQHMAVQKSLKYLDELNSETRGDPELTAELSNAYEKIGDLQGAYRGAGIGDSRAALASYSKALALDEQLVKSSGEGVRETRNQAALMRKYVRALVQTGKTAEAWDMAARAVTMTERLVQQHPADPGALSDLAQAHLRLGWVMAGSGSSSSTRQISEAIAHDRQAVEILNRLANVNDATAPAEIPRAELALGFHLGKARQFQESGRLIDAAIDAEEARAGKNSSTLILFYNLRGLTYERNGDQRRAQAEYEKALPLAESLAAADPRDLDAQLKSAIAKGHVAMQQARLDRPAAGIAGVNDATAAIERLYAADPSQSFYASLLTIAYAYEGELLSSMRDHEGAKLRYEKALQTAERIAKADPRDLESHLSTAKLHLALAVVLSRQRRYTDAVTQLRQALDRAHALLQERPDDAETLALASTVGAYLPDLERCADQHPCAAPARFQLPTLVN